MTDYSGLPIPPTARPFRENQLFRGDTNRWHTNACVGWNGGPYDFFAYAEGYFLGAELLIERIHQTVSNVDVLVYPICFGFRHAIELSVKGIADALARLQKDGNGYELGHALIENWRFVKAHAEALTDLFDPADIRLIDETIRLVCDVDPNGQIFRYPESTRRKMHLEDRSLINLSLLGERILAVHEVFKTWDAQVAVALEYHRERY